MNNYDFRNYRCALLSNHTLLERFSCIPISHRRLWSIAKVLLSRYCYRLAPKNSITRTPQTHLHRSKSSLKLNPTNTFFWDSLCFQYFSSQTFQAGSIYTSSVFMGHESSCRIVTTVEMHHGE